MTSPAPPPNRRRRFIVAGIVLVVLGGGLWWWSLPTIDPRLVGKWKLAEGQFFVPHLFIGQDLELLSNGIARRRDRPDMRWQVSSNQVYFDSASSRAAQLFGWAKDFYEIGGIVPLFKHFGDVLTWHDDTFDVREITPDHVILFDPGPESVLNPNPWRLDRVK